MHIILAYPQRPLGGCVSLISPKKAAPRVPITRKTPRFGWEMGRVRTSYLSWGGTVMLAGWLVQADRQLIASLALLEAEWFERFTPQSVFWLITM